MPKYVVLRDVPAQVQNRQPFRMSAAMAGSTHRIVVGRLPAVYVAAFDAAQLAADYYVVHSYATPIAWHANGVWVMPDVKYSRTTTRHQNIVRRGLDPAITQVVGA